MPYLTFEEDNIASRFLFLDTAIEILQKKEDLNLEIAIRTGIKEVEKNYFKLALTTQVQLVIDELLGQIKKNPSY